MGGQADTCYIITKMSWDSYIDNLLGHCADHADSAAIIGLDGACWTTHAPQNAIKITPAEAAVIGKAMTAGDMSGFQSSGIHIAGVKYQFLRDLDKTIVFGKKKDHGAITLHKSKTSVVLGHTKEGCQQANTNKGVQVITEYLETMGM